MSTDNGGSAPDQEEGRNAPSATRRQFLKGALGVGVAAVAGPLLAACGNSSKAASSTSPSSSRGKRAPKGEVVIAAVEALTGAGSAYGQPTANGETTAVRLVNARGGIKSLGGAHVILKIYDTQSSSATAVTVTRKALDEGAVIVTGAAGSPQSLVASQVCEEAKVPYLTTTDFAPSLLTRGFHYMFQADPSMTAIVQATLAFVKQEGARTGKPATRLGILATNDEVGAPSAQALQQLGPKFGFTVVATEEYPDGTTNFLPYLEKLKAAGADAVFGYQLTANSIAIVDGMSEIHYKPTAFGGILGGETTTAFVRSTGAKGNATLVASDFSPDLKIPGLPALVSEYQKDWHTPIDVNGAAGISAVGLMVAAIEAAGSTNPQKVRDALAAIDITAGEDMFIIVSGCKFNSVGYNVKAEGVVQQIYNGTFHSVYPPAYASDFTPKWPFNT